MTFTDYRNLINFYANNEKISHGSPGTGTLSVVDSFMAAERKGMQSALSVPEMKFDLEERFVQGQSED